MSPDQINALYQKYLGRAANPDEISGWQSGQYGATDPASVEAQIAASGEAQARQGGGGTGSAGAGSGFPKDFNTGTGGSGAAGGDQIQGWYQQYLGRAATPDEVQNWLNGTYGPTDPASIQQQIASSGEAQARQGGSGGGGGGGYGGGLGGGDNPFGPWSGSFTAPARTPTPAAPAWSPIGAAPVYQAPDYKQAPAFAFDEKAPTYTQAPAFSYADFTPPSYADAANDPGYQFRLQQGTDALQNAAAAKGTLADSGTLKALSDYGQGAASQEYQNVWNRAYNTYTTNRGNAFDTYTKNYQTQYQNPYNAAETQWQNDYANALGGYNANYTTQYAGPNAAAQAAAQTGYGGLLAGYGAQSANTTAQNTALSNQWATGVANQQHSDDITNTNAWNDYLLGFQDYQTRRNLGATFALQS